MTVNVSSLMTIVSAIITAVSTFVIALYAWRSYGVSNAIVQLTKTKDLEEARFKERIEDLYRAIVISNICTTGHGDNPKPIIVKFNELYKGKTRIFVNENKTDSG